MIFNRELHINPNENPVYTIYMPKRMNGFTLKKDEIARHGLVLHFEWFNYRVHLTVEVQPPPEGYVYDRLMYRHKNINEHNYCRTEKIGSNLLHGKQYHQIQTRFWLPRILFILLNPDFFRAVYRPKTE